MNIRNVLMAVSLMALSAIHAETITCKGDGPSHLQGVACDGSAIYWCFTTKLVKTDLAGTQIAAVDVVGHSGDLCVHNGKVYIATEEGRFVRSSNFKQEVRVYDAATLQKIKTYNLDEDCAARGLMVSAIEYANERFWLAMGQAESSVDTKNYVMEYTPSFEYVATHELATGNTQYGLQTIAYHGDKFYIGTYSGANVPASAFICDSGFDGFVPSTIPAAEGVMSVTGVLYTAVSSKGSNERWTAIAKSVEGLDRLYSVNGASGGLVDTPEQLLALGFMPKSRYYGGADGTISGSGTEQNNLIANAVVTGGNVFTLDHGDTAYAGGIAVPSGTLTVPSAAALNAPASAIGVQKSAPIVLSEGTLRINGGGTLTRDIALYPLAGCNNSGAILNVADGAVVTNTGTITSIDGHGNLFKTGAGTFVLATPGGNGVVTNFVGSHGENPGNWKKVVNFPANGDGPTIGNPSFGVFNGRFVIATGPKVVTDLGVDTYIGGPTTSDAGAETAGHLDIYSGIVRCSGFFTLGRDNGNAVTAPSGLSSTMNLYGGSFFCDTFDMSYTSVDSEQKNRPVLNVHGGTFDVANNFRMDYLNNYGTINVDGGILTVNNFVGANYASGGHVEINVSNGGKFVTKSAFMPVRQSSAEHPSYARVNVTNGGVFEMKTMANATCDNPDARYFFDGGILKSRQSEASDEITAYMPIDVGANGMIADVTDGYVWGLKIRSSIQAKSGVTDGGLRVVSTADNVDNHWLSLLGGVTLAGGVTISNAYLAVGCNVNAAVTLEDDNACIRPTADVTISSIAYTGKSGRYDVAMSGATGDSGVRAYIVTANTFTPPKGIISVHPWKQDTTTGSYPTGSFPFLRVPASSSIDASRFAYYSPSDASWWFEDSVADGWRTISIVHGTAGTRPAIDPRTSDDWLTGSDNAWTLGPWLLPVSGDKTTANYMLGGDGKGYNKAGGLSVSDSLTLSGGGLVLSGPFLKLGDGTLTLSGDKVYTFASSLGGANPNANGSNWNQFDSSGNATSYGYSVPLIVGAGTLVIGTGSDNTTVSCGNYPLWIGCPTTTAAGSETDAALEMKSGLLQVGSDFFVGRNRPASTAAHTPLVSSYVQSGGEVEANKLFVGYSDTGDIRTLQQTFNFTLNGGRFSTRGEARVGTYWGQSGSRGNVATMTINGGFLEIGTSDSDGYLRIGHSVQTNCTTSFEINGGEVMLWRGLLCPSAGGDDNHHTQLRLNGGTLTFSGASKPTLTGNAKADLYLNGTVLKPYRTAYLESCSTFDSFAVREIGSGGAIIDLSDANIDNFDIAANFTGSGDMIARGGNTNRAVRICYNLSSTGDFVAEKGGVIQIWHQSYSYFGNQKTCRIKDGGGLCSYYSQPIKNIYLGETAADSTFVYGYGYSSYGPLVASSLLQIKGTVYCAFRTSGAGNPIRVLKATLPILRGPKGSFEGVDVATQFKVHPLLAKPGLTVTFALDTSNSDYDQVTMTSSDVSYYLPGKFVQSSYPSETVLDGTTTISGTITPWVASTSLGTATSGGGTIKITEPLSGNGTIKLTTGRIEGRPEDFDGVTLDLNNASVRFTESGRSTVNLKNSDGGTTGLGIEVPEGKTVYVTGILTNRSALVKMDLGTLVLQSDAAFTLAGNAPKNANSAWVEGSVPVNGDVPTANALTVNAGTLVLDMPGTVTALNGADNNTPWVGNHPIPDGNGGALPAVMEMWQGEYVNTNSYMAIGRYNGCDYDNCSKFTSRPYAAFNLYGGTVRVNGLIMGYSYYKYTQCGLYELNIYDGLFEVGSGYVTIGFEGNSVRINGQDNECVVNVYGGEFRKLAGDRFMVGGKNSNWSTYIPKMKLNVYDGIVRTASSVLIEVPGSNGTSGYLNMYGGVVETKNLKDSSTSSRPEAEGHVRFDGGTFRPLEDNGALSGFSSVTVGAGGGTIDVTNANTYTVSQLARASDLGSAADGGFGASGTGTLVLNVANGFNGPTRVSGTATLKQGVANAFSDVAVLDGGTLDLNGIAATFRSIKGHGTIVGNCTVTEFLELDGALTVNGNLTLDNGVAMRMEIDDDGTALTPLTVTGALTGGSGISIDFGRYHDRAFRELQTQIGSCGAGSVFSAEPKHVSLWHTSSRVSCGGGAISLIIQPRGSIIIFR